MLDICYLSGLVMSCFNVPDIKLEDYSWVHTIYLLDEGGCYIGEIIVSRCDQEGKTFDISIPDYDRRKLLLKVNIANDSEEAIKHTFKRVWNIEVQWEIEKVKRKLDELNSTLIG